MMGVPATYLFMAQDPGFATADLWTLRRAVVGGAPMPEALLETWHERGVEIVQGYGLTEAAPNVLCLPPEDAARKRGFAGKPYPHVDVALRDTESGRLLDGAAEGELLVRGPNVFAGYWRNPEATDGRLRGRLARHRRHRRARRRGLLPDRRPARRTWSSRAARTSIRPRSRTCCTSTRPCGGRGRRRARRALGRGVPRVRRRSPATRPRTSCSSTAAAGSRATRCRRASASSTRCRGTRSTRSSSPSCWSCVR